MEKFRPGHDSSICALVHLAGEEQSMAPKSTSHCKFEALSFVAMQQIVTEPEVNVIRDVDL